jgi:hypothetical protein
MELSWKDALPELLRLISKKGNLESSRLSRLYTF